MSAVLSQRAMPSGLSPSLVIPEFHVANGKTIIDSDSKGTEKQHSIAGKEWATPSGLNTSILLNSRDFSAALQKFFAECITPEHVARTMTPNDWEDYKKALTQLEGSDLRGRMCELIGQRMLRKMVKCLSAGDPDANIALAEGDEGQKLLLEKITLIFRRRYNLELQAWYKTEPLTEIDALLLFDGAGKNLHTVDFGLSEKFYAAKKKREEKFFLNDCISLRSKKEGYGIRKGKTHVVFTDPKESRQPIEHILDAKKNAEVIGSCHGVFIPRRREIHEIIHTLSEAKKKKMGYARCFRFLHHSQRLVSNEEHE